MGLPADAGAFPLLQVQLPLAVTVGWAQAVDKLVDVRGKRPEIFAGFATVLARFDQQPHALVYEFTNRFNLFVVLRGATLQGS